MRVSASTSTARLLKYGLVVIAFALVAPSAAYSAGATKPPPKLKEKPAEPLGQWAYSRLTRAMEHLQEEDYEAAYSELADLRRAGSRLNAHEEAMMWQTYGFAQSSQGDADKAIESFETCLALQGLPGQAQLATRKNLAQLYLMNSNYPKAIENLEIWFAEVEEPGANEYYLLAIAYAHSGKQDVARGYAERAVQLSHAPNEARLQLLSAIYFRDERYEDLVPLLRELATHFPKKIYWMQLAGIYIELGRYEDALGVQEATYEQSMLSTHQEYITLARLLANNDVPYEAATVLEKGMADGVVEPTEEAWDLIGTAYLQAREYEQASVALEKAASLSADGAAYARLGQVYLGDERFEDARRVLTAAMKKGGLEDLGRSHMLLGIAQAGLSRFDEAKQSFTSALDYPDHAAAARQWISHVDQQAALAEAEAQLAAAETGSERGGVLEVPEHPAAVQ